MWVVGEPQQRFQGKTSFDLCLDYSIQLSIIEQITLLLDAGVSIQAAIAQLAEQYPMGDTRFFLVQISARLNVDADLAAAFGQFPKMFSTEMVAMLRPAQGSAQLLPLLRRFGDQIEQAASIRATVRRATSYPLFLVSICGLVIIGAIYFIVPKFEELLYDLVTSIPLYTKILFWIASFVRSWLGLIIVAAIGLGVGARYAARMHIVRVWLEKLVLVTPKAKNVLQSLALAQISANLGMLVGAGVPIQDAMAPIIDAIPWPKFKRALQTTLSCILTEGKIANGMKASKMFPPMYCAMVETAENVGNLPVILDKLTKWYAREAERSLAQALVFLEPALIVIMAIFVGWILISFFLPLAEIYNAVSGH
jgi:type II secretory pathway component PulF